MSLGYLFANTELNYGLEDTGNRIWLSVKPLLFLTRTDSLLETFQLSI